MSPSSSTPCYSAPHRRKFSAEAMITEITNSSNHDKNATRWLFSIFNIQISHIAARYVCTAENGREIPCVYQMPHQNDKKLPLNELAYTSMDHLHPRKIFTNDKYFHSGGGGLGLFFNSARNPLLCISFPSVHSYV